MRVLVHNRVDELGEKLLEGVLVPLASLALARKPVAFDVDGDLNPPPMPAVARAGPVPGIVKGPVRHDSFQENPNRASAFFTPSKRSAMLEE